MFWDRQPRRRVGRPTRSEAAAKAADAARAAAMARKQQLDGLRAELEIAQLRRELRRLDRDDAERGEIAQMADTIAKLRAAGVLAKGAAVGGEESAATIELVRALAPHLPALVAALAAGRNARSPSGPMVGPPAPSAAPDLVPVPSPGPERHGGPAGAPPEPPPAFADAALEAALRKRSPDEAATWLWQNRTRWGMVGGIVESLLALPEEELPAYLDYLARHYFPRAVGWLRDHPQWLQSAIAALRARAAAA